MFPADPIHRSSRPLGTFRAFRARWTLWPFRTLRTFRPPCPMGTLRPLRPLRTFRACRTRRSLIACKSKSRHRGRPQALSRTQFAALDGDRKPQRRAVENIAEIQFDLEQAVGHRYRRHCDGIANPVAGGRSPGLQLKSWPQRSSLPSVCVASIVAGCPQTAHDDRLTFS